MLCFYVYAYDYANVLWFACDVELCGYAFLVCVIAYEYEYECAMIIYVNDALNCCKCVLFCDVLVWLPTWLCDAVLCHVCMKLYLWLLRFVLS